MADRSIRFDDGAAYERFMGKWSQLAGETFLDWLTPEPGLRWLDVGCGNGAFTEMLVERFNIKPEELARASIEELLTRPDESFQKAADYILHKNAELYPRLA